MTCGPSRRSMATRSQRGSRLSRRGAALTSTQAQTVLDQFMGSGTTAVAAQIEGRDWIGIELSEQYADLARERISANRVG